MLIFVSAGVNFICDGSVYIKRNGTIVKDNWFGSSRTDDQYDYPQAAQTYLDSPATTSATTYKTQFASQANNAIIYVQSASGGTSSTSTITLMEIAA